MYQPFKTVDFNSQLSRSLSKVYRRFASVGECMAVGTRITDADTDSWFREWNALAETLEAVGRREQSEGRVVSARDALSRASEYYRQSTFYHRVDLDGRELQKNWRRARDSFRAAMALGPHSFDPVEIPFEGSSLHGYYFRSVNGMGPRPTIITPSGYDGTAEEALVMNGLPALERGFNVVVFDGPGQGNTLYDPQRRLFMRPDWENVLPAVVAFVVELDGVDEERLVAIGASFGGFLVPRGVSGEPRVAALIADPGQFDMGTAVRARLPQQLLARLDDDSPDAASAFEGMIERSLDARLMFEPRRAAHGQPTLQAYLRHLMQFTSEGFAERIRCPALVCDNETDLISAGQGEMLARHIQSPVDFIRFTESEGAGSHCEGAGREVYDQRVFEWLEKTLSTRLPA